MRPPGRWKRFTNWCYNKWMRFRGYKPYIWDMKNHRYTYAKNKELDKMVEVTNGEPEYEEVFYKRQETNVWYRDKETDSQAKMAVAKALREGKNDARIIRRPLQGE